MKIIITGASGFIGRNIATAMNEEGHEVLASGRNAEVGTALQRQGIRFVLADILKPDQLKIAFSPADCLIHCAAKTGGWGKNKDFFAVNVNGTRNIIQTCLHFDIKKIIFISSPSIYYTGRNRLNISEDDPLPLKQANHYSRTKVMAERELINLQEQGIKTIILRPRAVHGPYDTTIIPHILRLADRGRVPVINRGEALADVTYIENLVNVIKLCLGADETAWNQIYNVSNGEPIRVMDWFSQVLIAFQKPFFPKNIPAALAKQAALIMEAKAQLSFLKKEPPITRFSVGYLANTLTLSIEKARQNLGYVPGISNKQGFKLHAAWYFSQADQDARKETNTYLR